MKTIFIVLDTVRRDYLQAYGPTWVHTPNIARLAARSVRFDNHWVGSLPCMPARREFMTGCYNFPFRSWGPLEPYDDVLPAELRKHKVFSHLITDHYHYWEFNALNYHTYFDTWDFYRGQENDAWVSLVDAVAMPETMNERMSRQSWHNRLRQIGEEDFSASQCSLAAVRWLEDNKNADNYFLQVEIFDPHEPFYCTDKYREMYQDTWQGPLWDWPSYNIVKQSAEAVEHIKKCYAGLLTMTDHWLGRIFDKLDELDLWKDTAVILTTDHGTMLGEHRYWMKNHMPVYNEIARIPLLIHLPGDRMAGQSVNTLTQTIDLMPTILDLHHGTMPPRLDGHSLQADLNGISGRDDAIFGYFGMATNLTDGRYVYFRNPIQEDGGPLFAYTAMPTLKHLWQGDRSSWDQVEMDRYFTHMYNVPLYKIPAKGAAPRRNDGTGTFIAEHQLFDVAADPEQFHPLQDPEREAHFCQRIVEHLQRIGAPAEQFVRLGLG